MAQQNLDPTGQEREDYRIAKINSNFTDLYAGTGASGQAITPASVAASGNVQGATLTSIGLATLASASVTGALTAGLGTGTATVGVGGSISRQFSVAGSGNGADTSEDTLFTFSLPANSLKNIGQEVDVIAWGSVAATSATKTVKVYFGAITQTITYTTTQAGAWKVFMQVFKQAASVQLAITEVDALGSSTTRTITVVNNGAETDTSAIVIKVTGTSTAATANLVLCNGMVVSGYN